ncbi:MAG: tetratricopeptide repeat protein [Bacteroidetes bacterium]|nr:tetratricopeptide repeat protein [Bacteroidota bacterium]
MKRFNFVLKYVWFFILCFFSLFLSGQNKKLNTDSLKQIIGTTKYDTTKVNSLCALAFEIRRKAIDEALENVSKAMVLAKKINYKSGLGKAFRIKGLILKEREQPEIIIELYKNSLKNYKEAKDEKGLSEINTSIANFYRDEGNFDSAFYFYDVAEKITFKLKDSSRLSAIYHDKAGLYSKMFDYSAATALYLRSLDISIRIKDKLFEANCLNSLGGVYYNQKNYKKAEEYILKVIALRTQLKQPAETGKALGNLAKLYSHTKRITQAFEEYAKAEKIFIALKDSIGYISVKVQELPLYDKLNENQKIIDLGNKLVPFISALKPANYMSLHFGLGKAYRQLGKNDLALKELNLAMAVADKINNADALMHGYDEMYRVYAAKKDYKNAFIYLEQQSILKDSSLNAESAKQIAEMDTKYQTEKRKLEIKTLNTEKTLQQTELTRKNEEAKQRNFQLIAFAIGFLITLVLSVIVYRNLQKNKRYSRIIEVQKDEVEKQKNEVMHQKEVVEEKNKEITDSINYALRIQSAILPPINYVKEYLPESFILYQPKDIVAGDFYWMHISGDKIFIAAADSTGHGVPGALVSIVCANALNRTVNEFGINDTGMILDKTREIVIETFAKSQSDVKDGMDVSLMCIDKNKKQIQWSGANNPLWYIDDHEVKEIKGDKQPIGKSDNAFNFNTRVLEFKPGSIFYLFTDGFADQFGGEKGKKFKYKQLENLLLDIYKLPLAKQEVELLNAFNNWKGELEQVDDVCIIGIKV